MTANINSYKLTEDDKKRIKRKFKLNILSRY